jgi:hypothetical protein
MPVNCDAYQSNKSINKSRIDGINYRAFISPARTQVAIKTTIREVLHMNYIRNWKYNIHVNAYNCICVYFKRVIIFVSNNVSDFKFLVEKTRKIINEICDEIRILIIFDVAFCYSV